MITGIDYQLWREYVVAIKPTYHLSFLLPLLCSNLGWSKLIQLVIKFPCHTDQLTVDSSTNKTCH